MNGAYLFVYVQNPTRPQAATGRAQILPRNSRPGGKVNPVCGPDPGGEMA